MAAAPPLQAPTFLDHPGEMAQRIREHDWTDTLLGPVAQWPDALCFAIDICLGSSFPTAIYWSPALVLLYNDAWRHIPAERHPWALGRPAREVWGGDIWDKVAPNFERVLATGAGHASYDEMLLMLRDGRVQETWWNYSLTPIRNRDGTIGGVFNQGNETTRVVLAERDRIRQADRLRDLFVQAPGAVALLHGPEHVFELANPAYQELVGGRPLIGRSVVRALPEMVGQGFVELLDQVYASGEAFRATGTPVLIDRGGVMETRLLDFVYQPIRDANGNTTDIFIEANDVTERVLAEAALRQSEERLQLALDSSLGVGTWDWDVAANMVTADVRFARLYGVDPAIAGDGAPIETFFAGIHPDDAARVDAAVQLAIARGVPFSEEYRLVQTDGSIRWVSAQGRCTFDEDGQPRRFPGVSFDITARREAEDAAIRTAEELRLATEAQAFLYALAERQRALDTPQAILRLTASTLARRLELDRVGFHRVMPDGTLQFGPCWNNGALPPLQGSLSIESLGAIVDAYRDGRTSVVEDSAIDPTAAGTGIERLSPAAVGVPLLRGGVWVATMFANQAAPRRWTPEEVAFIEAVAEQSWDAVERASAVAALKESEEKFRAIANSIDQMVWSTRPDGFHDYYNDRWYEYTGVPYGSTNGDGWNALFHPDDQDRAWSVWNHSLETGDVYRIEYRLRHRSGAYRWVLGRAQPVRDDDGRITRWFGTCTDIQDIVDAREVLAQSREELERAIAERTSRLMETEERLRQAQKMEAVGQLTGGIAHDFNNMLAVVIGALDLIERRIAQGRGDLDRYLTAARDGATRAAALTQRLLAFSRQQPLAPAPVDMNEMVLGMIELLTRTLGEAVTVETFLGAELNRAVADPNQLENAILNLSVNARDAMPGGGTLHIETANCVISPELAEQFGISAGDYVMVAVADTGIGMATDVAARAFDPFFTTKGVGKGTGLGLSQVFGFVRQSGGHVRIQSEPGAGTTVRLYLPVHRGDPAVRAERVVPAEQPRARPGETVLVVEDEERVRNFSVEALGELGYIVVHAPDGREALRMIDAGQPVSLLFTDVVMPEMTGQELASAVRLRLPRLKVLYTSGYTPDAVSIGPADTLLPKPFDLNTLATRIRASLDA